MSFHFRIGALGGRIQTGPIQSAGYMMGKKIFKIILNVNTKTQLKHSPLPGDAAN